MAPRRKPQSTPVSKRRVPADEPELDEVDSSQSQDTGALLSLLQASIKKKSTGGKKKAEVEYATVLEDTLEQFTQAADELEQEWAATLTEKNTKLETFFYTHGTLVKRLQAPQDQEIGDWTSALGLLQEHLSVTNKIRRSMGRGIQAQRQTQVSQTEAHFDEIREEILHTRKGAHRLIKNACDSQYVKKALLALSGGTGRRL
ncbi:hypothetical protein DFS34DRAFT_318014 [Phlyctochytrium arcticum]|nr:hypothetical protein DFS34DRAFT_318014 [Phlyctochytrium arcticum]